ncbi:unnamed protein product [Microthlaspi erraticum]|uniref:Uncharacterized protein n=1 Tax=Microthlaspi erraticum TaxID=1685480 RepID=A0A6D2K5S5_9BRAS|nr:unnamed protein product [Microthlaspi erraticum]
MSLSSKLDELEELTSNAKQIQDDVLEEILKVNTNTEYLRRFLGGRSDKEFFKKNVPVVSYEDVRPYIERVAKGEPSDVISGEPITHFLISIERVAKGEPSDVISGEPITHFLISSGTSGGKQKIFPVNKKYFENFAFICALRSSILSKHIDGVEGGKVLTFLNIGLLSTTPSGLPIASAVTSFLMSDIDGFKKRDSVSVTLGGPNLELADLIEHACSQKSWEGIITRLWPNVKSIQSIVTGQMSQYIPILEFYSNKLPLISMTYASSEAVFGLNLNPLCKPQDVSYTFIPSMSYFEFLPVDARDNDEIVDLVNVKLGCFYEVLVTNHFGLYRYRMGDILQVNGFYNAAPQFKFIRRRNIVLSIQVEATTEEDVLLALNNARLVLESSGLMLMGFTCYSDVSSVPGHYVLYWELRTKNFNGIVKLDNKVMVECCYVVEESFDDSYKRFRSRYGSIGALEIRVVQQGTFDSIMEYFISAGASPSQYKTPLSVNSPEVLAILEDRVLARFFSDKSPPFLGEGSKDGSQEAANQRQSN